VYSAVNGVLMRVASIRVVGCHLGLFNEVDLLDVLGTKKEWIAVALWLFADEDFGDDLVFESERCVVTVEVYN